MCEFARAECCPLARVRVYSEELRSLRKALQLMVQRGKGIGSEADGKGSDPSGAGGAKEPGMEPIAKSATPETSTVTQQPAPSQQSSPVLPVSPLCPLLFKGCKGVVLQMWAFTLEWNSQLGEAQRGRANAQ